MGYRTPTPVTLVHIPPTLMTIPPTIITAAPGTIPALVTPIVQITTPLPATEAPLLPTTTPIPPEPTIASIPANVPPNPQTRAFALSTNNGAVIGSGFPLPFAAQTFARNPQDASRMAVVNSRGLLYMLYNGLTTQDAVRVRVSPFSDFEPQSAADNQARVTQIGWSPDGRYLAFLVDSEADDRDGVWYTDNPDQSEIRFATQVFRECPPPVTACTVNRGGEPTKYNSLHFDWNSRSNSLLIDLWLPDENRRAFTVVGLNTDPTQPTHTYRYDYASWSVDGTRVLVSGTGSDGRVALRWIDPATGSEQIIFDGSAAGLWLQSAVERPNGQIVALGSRSGQNSAQSIYNSSGQPLTPPIGTGAPERVSWSPDRSAVLVVVNDGAMLHYYVAEVSGSVREITASVAGALAVEWIGEGSSPLPPSSDQPVASPAPTSAAPAVSVGAQSSYGITTNRQVQVVATSGVNLHSYAGLAAPIIGLLNTSEYVIVTGGPVQADGLIWWQVQRETTGSQTGWAAESFNGAQLLSP